ncbi:MAG: twin-arginine translocase TatA/TatE family subunit [Acidobacteria bacterium]|nr:twin-arginine translocase TatA/TatE family subunit [Acidobacteriota bacterium]
MVLLIFNEIGTPELMMIGLAALILLGPRRLPEFARKAGKMLADFRATTSEFKETWEREVNFEEETKALRIQDIENEVVERQKANVDLLAPAEPEIRELDADEVPAKLQEQEVLPAAHAQTTDPNDKRNWL